MDSGSRRLPFCLPSTRSSYTSSTRLSSSSLGSSRLHSWEVSANNDRFPRAPSAYKAELDHQSSHLGASRDLSSSDSHSASWKLPSSLTSSSRSYDRSWAESSLTSRTKLTDSEGTLGMRSVLLNATDDGDSKRAKLSFSNRGLHSRTPSSLVTGSTFSSNGLNRGRDAADKQNDASSWTSCRLFSRSSSSSSSSSKPLLSRRELETKNESSLSDQTDRVTSTYALGARPKETTYCSPSPSSYSSTVRESSRNHHTSPSTSCCSSLGRDFSNRTPARFSNASSSLHSSQEQPRSYRSSSDISSSYQSRTTWYTTPPTRAQAALPPRPGPEGGESEGHRSTRRLLSRLFSRRSSQDSSSGSSVRSLDDDGPSIGAQTVVSNQGYRKVESNTQSSEAAFGVLRNRRADLAPIQENKPEGYHRGPGTSRMPLCRERGVGSNNTGNGGSTSSWISSSLPGRRSPLLSRLRRHTRNESDHSSAGSEEGRTCPQRLLRRWDNLEHNVSQGDDDDDEEEHKEAGAFGLGAFGESRPSKLEDEKLPELNEGAIEFSPRPGRGLCDNISLPTSSFSGVEHLMGDQREKPISSTDHDKLRKIKERLLLEDSDEEEGDLCRICQMGEESACNPLIQPCHCIGSLQYVHQECIKRWLCSKISSATNLEAISTCELCKEKLHLNIDNFDIQELYRTRVQSEYDEFISSGLYLVVLLHFCEQRFSDVLGAVDAAGLFNLLRILHEHMDNLQNQHSEDEEEARDSRPSVEFSDLDDDLEEEY